ncbi:molybdenum cofactor guanylyltransferase MobA [Desulfurococcaceae archaeon MEX13E-LK6-19]|nr:molybdenum cofactor guanylyltransferase MobA [Desulfurococcaceae archaeon MEX13E-LK6-19]
MRAVVLAGGPSRRFKGDKIFYRINGKPMILYVLDKLSRSRLIEEVHVITSPDRVHLLHFLGVKNVIVDHLLIGPIGGILISLEKLGDVFIVAADMPLLNPTFIDHIIELYKLHRHKYLAYVPAWRNGYLEPLHAVYTRDILGPIRDCINNNIFSIQQILRLLGNKVYKIVLDDKPSEYKSSVYNVNTRSDLERIINIILSELPHGFQK